MRVSAYFRIVSPSSGLSSYFFAKTCSCFSRSTVGVVPNKFGMYEINPEKNRKPNTRENHVPKPLGAPLSSFSRSSASLSRFGTLKGFKGGRSRTVLKGLSAVGTNSGSSIEFSSPATFKPMGGTMPKPCGSSIFLEGVSACDSDGVNTPSSCLTFAFEELLLDFFFNPLDFFFNSSGLSVEGALNPLLSLRSLLMALNTFTAR
mmetsp:Transcript_24887/g.40975  ORF Transcript_24887/g.40975 Transcript_24887/m.40975 type:complete len:204 (-) Transcript_24887:171-782(-)